MTARYVRNVDDDLLARVCENDATFIANAKAVFTRFNQGSATAAQVRIHRSWLVNSAMRRWRRTQIQQGA